MIDRNKGQKHTGAVTVEACLVIPLFLFFFLSMASIIMIFFCDAHIHQSLSDTGQVISRQCYKNQIIANESISNISDGIVLNTQFLKFLGNDFFVERVVLGGRHGITLSLTEDNKNPKIFYLKADYVIKVHVPILGTLKRKGQAIVKQKGFVGYTKGEEEIDPYVYVTPNQAVYHCSRSCTHLSLSVREVSDANRSLYKPCRFCRYAENNSGTIYVTRTSNLYHESRGCSGLKRSVTRVKKSMVAGLPPCGRCGR